jgi:synaptic vesicle membrane protein VAT-1
VDKRISIKVTKYGGPDGLRVVEENVPDPGTDDVLISTRYAGINFADLMAGAGLYPGGPKPPFIPGLELSGTIMDPGRFGDRFRCGDPVAAFMPRFGAYANVLTVPFRYVRKLSPSADLQLAAAFPATYMTAFMMLEQAHPEPGETVLVHGAGGGVGTALVDLAGLRGLRIIGTSSVSKHRKLESLNMELVLDSTEATYRGKVLSYTNGKGVNIVFDSRGPSAFRESYNLLAPFGKLVMYGIQDLKLDRRFSLRTLGTLRKLLQMRFTPLKLMNENRGVLGFSLGRLPDHPRSSASFDELVKLFEAGALSPVLDNVYPATEIAAAHRRLLERKNVGKVLLDFGAGNER